MVQLGRPHSVIAAAVARRSASISLASDCPPSASNAASPSRVLGSLPCQPKRFTTQNVNTLSLGPSIYNCTCECWSVVPSAAIGVCPVCTTSPLRLRALPSDSAHSCRNQNAAPHSLFE